MRSWMIGLVLGILPVLLLPRLPGYWLPVLLVPLGVRLGYRGGIPLRFCAGLVLGCALALLHGQLLLATRISTACVGQALWLSGEVVSLPRHSEFAGGNSRQRFEFAVREFTPARCSGPRRVLLSYYGPAKMRPGDSWRFPVKLSKPWGLVNNGSFNLQAWYAQTGIDAVGTVSGGPGVRASRQPSMARLPNRLRQAISERITGLPLASNVTAILAALTVADKSGIDARLWQLFQQYGINHLLVISGLHIGLVAGAAYLLGNLVRRLLLLGGVSALWLPGLVALVLAGAYTMLAGFSVATQRALCMLVCFIVASMAGRASGAGNTLLVAATVVLVLNPMAALGSGFWLSFAAVAALLWLASWQHGKPRWQRLLWTHGFMSLAMLPLGAWWFGGSSVIAALANLLMVPLVGVWVVPAALLAVLSMYVLPWLEWPLWQLAAWPLRQLLPAAQWLADNSAGRLFQPLAGSLVEVLLAALGVMLIILPVCWQARILAVLMVLPLVLPRDYPAHPGRAGAPAGLTRVTVLDVGQGTAVVVRAAGHTLLYDTGGGDPVGANMAVSVVLPWLRQQGVAALDTLVISHPDNDHSAGAGTVLAAVPVGRVVYGGDMSGLGRGRPCRAGQAWRWPGGQEFQFLSPAGGMQRSSNNDSCVLQIKAGGHRLLLAGDIESGQERELVRYWGGALRSDWLLVAHHGSRTSSSYALLKRVQPDTAAISSGYANRFGHPHPDVVARLGEAGITVYNTALGGELAFEFAPGERVRVSSLRASRHRFWM